MQITLYSTSSAKNVLNKTLTTIETYSSAALKEPSSIMDPVIILEYASGIFSANYMYIPEFGRYYFITKITAERQRVIIESHCDVLMSFKTEILAMSGYIARSVNLRNLYMNDKMFRVQNNRLVDIAPFSGGRDAFTTAGEYILVVAGPQSATPEPTPEPEGGE